LKTPGTKPLKQKQVKLLSICFNVFKFNLRRYTEEEWTLLCRSGRGFGVGLRCAAAALTMVISPGHYDKVRHSVTSKAKHGPITGSDQTVPSL